MPYANMNQKHAVYLGTQRTVLPCLRIGKLANFLKSLKLSL